MPKSSDPVAAGRQRANLLRGASPNPDGRARQLANLQRGREGLHRAYSPKHLAPLQEKHDAELAQDYPNLDRRRRALLADRLARVELASAWTREHGITPMTRGKRHAEAYPIVDRLERWASRAEDMLAVAQQGEREAGANHGQTLAQYEAELLAAGELEDGDGAEAVNDGDGA